MSSTITPKPLEGSAGLNQLELLWETHKRKVIGLFGAVLLFFGIKFLLNHYNQKQIDAKWGTFASSALLQNGYSNPNNKQTGPYKEMMARYELGTDLVEQIGKVDDAQISQAIASAAPEQKPFLMLLQARRALQAKEWDKADGILAKIQSDFPEHTLVKATKYPIQAREDVKEKEPDPKEPKDPAKKPKLVDVREGSVISLLRDQIAQARTYEPPAQFQKPAIPADAPKFKIKFSGDYGEAVIALFDKAAPKHVEAFKKLVEANHWNQCCVDEVERSTGFREVMQMHFGFLSTKEEDRSKWNTTDPSTSEVPFEDTGLSHFAGAICARPGADDKSQVDRIWITGNDTAGTYGMDGERVVFGYVVEGLDNIKKICKTTLSTQQEEEANKGRPSDRIVIESITPVQ